MKFMMLICWDAVRMNAQTEPGPTEGQEEDSFHWLDDIRARGISVAGDRLAPPRRARTVRVRDGKAILAEGPFTKTQEAVGVRHRRVWEPRRGRRDCNRTSGRPDRNDRGPDAVRQLTGCEVPFVVERVRRPEAGACASGAYKTLWTFGLAFAVVARSRARSDSAPVVVSPVTIPGRRSSGGV
jgi:hypothetical protein